MIAAALHPRVRSQASGSHYTSEGVLPLVPGVDGVARFPDGTTRYVAIGSDVRGSFAERVAVDPRASVVLPDGADPAEVAAAVNPVMSSWVALRRRITMPADATVLVLGATGIAGGSAVRVAKRLGAAHVVASGRNPERLAALAGYGADETIPLADTARIGETAAEADVVLDYLWGVPAADTMRAIVTARRDRAARLDWVSIGSSAGAESPIPSAALRASGLTVVGSGQGSVGRSAFVAELPSIVEAIADGLTVPVRTVGAEDVASAWTDADAATRTVFTF